MAINVYLTFYHKFDANRLRQMEKWYFLACFGMPFIPAVSYLFVQAPGKGRIYGNSMLWCWVTEEYDYLRIGTFYGPIWLVVVATGGIYLRAGREIWKKRGDLTKMINAGGTNYGNHQLNPYDFETGMIYELRYNGDFEAKHHPVVNVNTLGRTLSAADKRSRGVQAPRGPPTQDIATEVTVTSEVTTTIESDIPATAMRKPTYEYHIGTMPMFPSKPKKPKQHRNKERNRPRNVSNPAKKEQTGKDDALSKQLTNDPHKTLVAYQANKAAWGYTKVSAMFFAAMLITWVPSSANRMWTAANGGDISIALTYASAFVLPLQGMWNAVIYCLTSGDALKEMWDSIRRRKESIKEERLKEEDEVEMIRRRKSGVLGDCESQAGRSSPDAKMRPESKYSSSTVGSASDSRYDYMHTAKREPECDATAAAGVNQADFDSRSQTRSGNGDVTRGAHGSRSIRRILKDERKVSSGVRDPLRNVRARPEDR